MSFIQPGDSPYDTPELTANNDGNRHFDRMAHASPTMLELRKTLSRMRSWTRKLSKLSWTFLERHWITTSIVVMVSIVAISMAIGWSLRLRFFKAETFPPFINSTNDILLSANLISIDPVGQTMMIDWAIYDDVQQEGDCQDVNIYIDQNQLRTGSISSSPFDNEKPSPIFFVNCTDYLLQTYGGDFRFNSLEFRTQIAISNLWRTAQDYPFDKYYAQITLFAQTPENVTVPIGIDETTGIAVGYNAKFDTIDSSYGPHGELVASLTITRGQVIRIYAILIVLSIWLVTLTFVATCVITVAFGKGIKPDILVVPVGALFAFTQLRSTMPGAPSGFGADIDFMGILPCLALMTLASVFMSAVFLFRRNPEDDTDRWKKLVSSHGPLV
ncbi:uncharacterized protein LAESUDRAFT_721377 [Laetiporus sulphureus 93-53]|uniref:DUF4436 domain-containing protein n=1 Tax=Laetiporus sulphureus 93-53 TaxID=1314785 RepID=A0A165GXE9_9APHY|nr:uncharacterized protein LAESUDRAFT_721377 [Laetiporus sulphureus 93-53]KZT10960.1 hypothetical protein LAESUDRAFT_721377 [Laetiporus sulphureus 93-53]